MPSWLTAGENLSGLVGLETMAAGGMAFTGSTGEDYAIPFHNSIVLETSDSKEIESYVMYLAEHPQEDDPDPQCRAEIQPPVLPGNKSWKT